ncbi:metal ABC transporter permease [Erysipelotrichaceae bacterium OH741_COT-311]|nr:metal ABC transporter permease [Erysipelotrichaceae bacterium OH741_COT-311]
MREVLMVLVMASLATGILAPFLVLRNLSMTIDALSHSILLGIVLAFMLIGEFNTVLLIAGASIFGLFTVWLTELLANKKLVSKDQALAVVFPLFFSIAVIIITKFLKNAHIDVDIVLMGNALFTPFIRMFHLPKSFVLLAMMFVVNVIYIAVFYRPLKIAIFDEDYAKLQGIKSKGIFNGLMVLTAMTTVIAFDSVGAILVICYFVTPVCIALMITKTLKSLLFFTLLFSVVGSVLGFYIGITYNVSLSGSLAFVLMMMLILMLIINPQGLLAHQYRKYQHLKELNLNLLLMHLYKHQDNTKELGYQTIHTHLNWTTKKFQIYLKQAYDRNYVENDDERSIYQLTDQGFLRIKEVMGSGYDKKSRRLH